MNSKDESFFRVIYNIRVRVVSDIQTLAFGSSLYTRTVAAPGGGAIAPQNYFLPPPPHFAPPQKNY